MATSRCVTDFSICESCCWGCIGCGVSDGCLVLGAGCGEREPTYILGRTARGPLRRADRRRLLSHGAEGVWRRCAAAAE